jgi:UDP-glucose 4-epimerase
MRVAVTGGAGYIGSVVTEVLQRDGHDVLVLDNLSKGHLDAVGSATFLCVDLADRDGVARALGLFETEAVVHMAASSLVGASVNDPAAYYRNNVVAGLSLLDAMRDSGVGRLVFSSTAASTASRPGSRSMNTMRRSRRTRMAKRNWHSSAACAGTRGPTASARSAFVTSTPRERPRRTGSDTIRKPISFRWSSA